MVPFHSCLSFGTIAYYHNFFCSWGSGANAWGDERDDKFTKPNHWDGMLEVVGVTGVVHLGQIQSGLRSAIRIVQVSWSWNTAPPVNNVLKTTVQKWTAS